MDEGMGDFHYGLEEQTLFISTLRIKKVQLLRLNKL